MKAAAQELYRKYLNNELSGKALMDFKERLDSDVVFRKDFELYKGMEGFVEIKVDKRKALEVLKAVGKEKSLETKVLDCNKYDSYELKWFLILLFLIGAAAVWLTNSSMQEKKRHERMLAEYQYPPNRGTRSLEIANTKLDSAIHYFDLRRMAESEQLFLKILETDSQHQDANRYMGHISFLIDNDSAKSLSYIRKLKTLERTDSLLIKIYVN